MFNETLFRLKVNMMCGGGGGGGGGGDAGEPGGGMGPAGTPGAAGMGAGPSGGASGGTGASSPGGSVGPPGTPGAAGMDAGPAPGPAPGGPGGGWDEGDIASAFTGDIEGTVGAGDITGGLQGAEAEAMLAAINQAVSESMTETSQVSKAQSFVSKAAHFLGNLFGGKLGGMALGAITDALISNYNMSPITAEAVTGQLANGEAADSIAASLSSADFGDGGPSGGGPADPVGGTGGTNDTSGTGGTGGDVATNDPLSYDFWNNFVDEWMGKNGKSAKTMYSEDDAFKKSKVEPAIGKYQAALADLTNQAQTGTGTFTPTTFGMGNFRSSFVPKSGHLTADKLKDYAKEGLTSELALTDVMQPNKGSMDYLTALQALAQFDKEAQLRKYGIDMGYNTALDSIKEGQEDKGSWLDVIKDVVQIGDTVGDAWSKYF